MKVGSSLQVNWLTVNWLTVISLTGSSLVAPVADRAIFLGTYEHLRSRYFCPSNRRLGLAQVRRTVADPGDGHSCAVVLTWQSQ
jgi:hypothetical protein